MPFIIGLVLSVCVMTVSDARYIPQEGSIFPGDFWDNEISEKRSFPTWKSLDPFKRNQIFPSELWESYGNSDRRSVFPPEYWESNILNKRMAFPSWKQTVPGKRAYGETSESDKRDVSIFPYEFWYNNQELKRSIPNWGRNWKLGKRSIPSWAYDWKFGKRSVFPPEFWESQNLPKRASLIPPWKHMSGKRIAPSDYWTGSSVFPNEYWFDQSMSKKDDVIDPTNADKQNSFYSDLWEEGIPRNNMRAMFPKDFWNLFNQQKRTIFPNDYWQNMDVSKRLIPQYNTPIYTSDRPSYQDLLRYN